MRALSFNGRKAKVRQLKMEVLNDPAVGALLRARAAAANGSAELRNANLGYWRSNELFRSVKRNAVFLASIFNSLLPREFSSADLPLAFWYCRCWF